MDPELEGKITKTIRVDEVVYVTILNYKLKLEEELKRKVSMNEALTHLLIISLIQKEGTSR